MDTSSKVIPLESEAGFRVLFEYATIGILVISESGRIELANPCAEQLFGYSAAELIGESIEILIPENLRTKHAEHRERYFSRPKARPMGLGMELYARKKDGEVFPVEISLGHYEFEGEKLAVGFVTDVTEHKKAQKLLAEREAWFREMADNAPVMIWVSGLDKLCTYFNNAWLNFTSRTIEQELGNGWAEGVHPEDLSHCLKIYTETFDAREPFQMEYRLRRHDGKYRWVFDVGKPTYTSQGTFTGYIGSCIDIHDQRMAKEELESMIRERTLELSDALEREKELGEMKSRFVGMASHEFRTPLSIVLSSAALLEQYISKESDNRLNKHVSRIKSSVNNLTAILNEFLSLDKLEQGKVEVEQESLDLPSFSQEVVEEVRDLLKDGQRIQVMHGGPEQIWQDKKILRNVLLNLLSNAIKYSSERQEIFLHTEVKDKWTFISIKDNGIGIPEEEQEHMYKKFFRAKNTVSIQGTGLGLSIVKRYVELLKGMITFTSKVNEGTTFTVKFPQNGN